MNNLKDHSRIMGSVLLVVLLFIASAQSQCPCAFQTSCQLVSSAQAIIQARIISQTSQTNNITFTATVKKSLKGNFTADQRVVFSANPKCVKLKNGKTYILSLVVQGTGWWHDSCGIRGPRSLISSDLWSTIVNPSKCVTGMSCIDQSGATHQSGTNWAVGACRNCSCQDGTTTCVSLVCPPVPCANSYVPPGQCCPICPQLVGSCIFEGNTYLNNQYWNPDTCRSCHCANGTTTCVFPVCPTMTCNNSYVPAGECCPICPQSTGRCVSGKMSYNNGDDWYQSACRRCHCDNGVTNCFDIDCAPTNCSNAYVPSGQCCPVCPHTVGQCLYEGSIFNDGQSWNPTSCRSCRCDRGVTTCQTTLCPSVSCANSYVPVGECCPICPLSIGQCQFDGDVYNNGQTWNPTTCKNCRCNDGVTTCVTTVCGELPCNNSYTPKGQCCPVCPASNCYDQDGNTYVDGQQWKPADCMQCSCSNGTTRCTSYNCVLPDCPDWYIPSGQCCPVCQA